MFGVDVLQEVPPSDKQQIPLLIEVYVEKQNQQPIPFYITLSWIKTN